jgi:phage terminase large subunit
LSYEPTPFNIAQGTSNKSKWEMYGLGKRVKLEGLVFENGFEWVDEIPAYIPLTKRFTAIDFGFTVDPTSISEVAYDLKTNTLYIDELVYRTHMLTSHIIKELQTVGQHRGVNRHIVAESADPRLIAEIDLAGFTVTAVEKGKGSIMAGLDKMQEMKIRITRRSINAAKELKNYVWATDKNGNRLNEPIDDAVRYVVLMMILGQMRKPQDLKRVFAGLP